MSQVNHPSSRPRRKKPMTYSLTLCHPDGALHAVIPDAPVLPRYLHVMEESIALSDDAEPDAEMIANDATTFMRVASSVWVDDERDALFVRVL
jgi:hypothetical protein